CMGPDLSGRPPDATRLLCLRVGSCLRRTAPGRRIWGPNDSRRYLVLQHDAPRLEKHLNSWWAVPANGGCWGLLSRGRHPRHLRGGVTFRGQDRYLVLPIPASSSGKHFRFVPYSLSPVTGCFPC